MKTARTIKPLPDSDKSTTQTKRKLFKAGTQTRITPRRGNRPMHLKQNGRHQTTENDHQIIENNARTQARLSTDQIKSTTQTKRKLFKAGTQTRITPRRGNRPMHLKQNGRLPRLGVMRV